MAKESPVVQEQLENHCQARHEPVQKQFATLWLVLTGVFALVLGGTGGAWAYTLSMSADVSALKKTTERMPETIEAVSALKVETQETKEWRAEVRAQLREIRQTLQSVQKSTVGMRGEP